MTEQKDPGPNTPVASPAAPAPSAQTQASPTSPQSDPPPAPPRPSSLAKTVDQPPQGYVRTHFIEFVNGVLHQLHQAPHEGQDPPAVLVPVPGASAQPNQDDLVKRVEERVRQVEQAFQAKFAALEARLNTPAPTPPPAPASAPTEGVSGSSHSGS